MRGRCGTCSIGRVPSQVDERCARIARIVRDRRADILARWMSQVRADDTIPSARSLTDRVLAWAAEHQRMVLTHDVSTMTAFAYQRVAAGLPMPGLVEVKRQVPLGHAIEDIILIAEGSVETVRRSPEVIAAYLGSAAEA